MFSSSMKQHECWSAFAGFGLNSQRKNSALSCAVKCGRSAQGFLRRFSHGSGAPKIPGSDDATKISLAAMVAATGTKKTASDQSLNLEPGMEAKLGYMMCLAGMSALLLTLSWTFLKDMKFALRTTRNSKNEENFEGIMVANSKTASHKRRHCRGLQNAVQSRIKSLPGCKFCFPDGLATRGTRVTTEHSLGRLAGFGFGFDRSAASSCLSQQEVSCIKVGPRSFVMNEVAPFEQEPRSMKYTIVVEEKVTFQDGSKRTSLEDEQGVVPGVVHVEEQEHAELMAVSMERRPDKNPNMLQRC